MKVVTMCCTLNEERNIERYCEVYSRFSDRIVICDGGSTDKTVEIAESFKKVKVVHFDEILSIGGFPWNPKGAQHALAYATARDESPDWIIADECDSVPTLPLQEGIRALLRTREQLDVIGVMRLYVLGKEEFFPKMSLGGFYGWAHRANKVDGGYKANDSFVHRRLNFPKPNTWRNVNPPFALLHFGWPDTETADFKTERYRAVGILPPHGKAVPANAGAPERLPRWAKWN
jgi:glycosyltransferase involved in cell wall biosynthesis